jgi:hypothetical protein
MSRSPASRRFLGLALAATASTGIGIGIGAVWPASGAEVQQAARAGTAAVTAATPGALQNVRDTTAASAAASAPLSSPLNLDEATAVAMQASPGRVVEAKADDESNEANDPNEANEANDPNEADDRNDPNEADDSTEPTGLEYEVTVLHDDGTATKVKLDGANGRVVSTKLDDDWNGR